MEVQPNLIWGPAVGERNVAKLFCGVEECKPWTKKDELPGRSYKTSHKISHPPLQPTFGFVETKPIKLNEGSMLRDYRYKKIHYVTSYNNAYTYKFNSHGLTDTPNVPHAICYKFNYQWLDKLRTFPPGKMDPGISEMKFSYKQPKYPQIGSGVLSDLKPKTICQIYAPGKEALDKTDVNINCIQKINDPYISNSHYDYVYFESGKIDKYKDQKPQTIQIFEKKPVYDESFLGKRFLDRIVRKKIPMVPNRGMISETKENYKYPLDELAHKKLHVCSMMNFKPLTKGEVMAIPGMYHTDYEHIGHNWPLSSVV